MRLIESFVTLGAGVLLIPHVIFYMWPQVSSSWKSPFTLRAGVGPFSCVDSNVNDQVTGLGEGLGTGGAGEDLIACVCPLVSLQVTRVRESLVTLGAGIGFLPGVVSHVGPQVLWPGEGFCTLGAGVRSHATVCPLVTLQVIIPRESLVTLGTGQWFPSVVNSHVNTQEPDREKDFVHWEQEYGVLPLWILWCLFRLLELEKVLSQTVQGKSCPPVWVRWCDFMLEEQENNFLHILQSKGFSPEWVRMWVFRWPELGKILSHTWQRWSMVVSRLRATGRNQPQYHTWHKERVSSDKGFKAMRWL